MGIILFKLIISVFTVFLLMLIEHVVHLSTERFFQGKRILVKDFFYDSTISLANHNTIQKNSKIRYPRTLKYSSVISFVCIILCFFLLPMTESYYFNGQKTIFELVRVENNILVSLVILSISAIFTQISLVTHSILHDQCEYLKTLLFKISIIFLLLFLQFNFCEKYKVNNFLEFLEGSYILNQGIDRKFFLYINGSIFFILLIFLHTLIRKFNVFKSNIFEISENKFNFELYVLSLGEKLTLCFLVLYFVILYITPQISLFLNVIPYSMGPVMYIFQYSTILCLWLFL